MREHANAGLVESAVTPEDFFYLTVPICGLTIAEGTFRVLHVTMLRDTPWGPTSLLYAQFVILPVLIGFAGAGVFKRLRQRILPWLLGVVLAVIAIRTFRGSHYWPGTFDMNAWSFWYTIIPFMLSVPVQYVASKLIRPNLSWWFSIGTVAIGGLWVWIDAYRDIGLYTLHPYSRQYAVTTVAGVTLVLTLVGKRFAV